MYELALTLSIISSIIFIIYLLTLIFSPKQDNIITIRGSFTTRHIDAVGNSYTINRVIDHH